MKKLALLLPLFVLAACGAGAQGDDPEPHVQTCMTHAVRSQAGSYTEHSTDRGATWLPGDCK